MKNMRSLVNGMVACGVALAMISTLAAQTSQGVATVIRIKGSARYADGKANWKPLRAGDVLKPGTVIQTETAKGSYVDLAIGDDTTTIRPAVYNASTASPALDTPPGLSYQPKADQNVIRLTENTALGIDKLTSQQTGADVVTDTQLDLKQGRILGNVKKMSAASRYEIKLPNGMAGIRGTFFDISAEGVVRVFVGSVVIAYVGADGNMTTQVVSSNNQFDARSGQMTPLSASQVGELSAYSKNMVANSARGGRPEVIYTRNHTIYFVSPKGPPVIVPNPVLEGF